MKKLIEPDLPETERHRRVCLLIYNILGKASWTDEEPKVFPTFESMAALDALQDVIEYERDAQADKGWDWFIDKEGHIDMDSWRYLSLRERRKRLIASGEIAWLLEQIVEKSLDKSLAEEADFTAWILEEYRNPEEYLPEGPWTHWAITHNGTLLFPSRRTHHPHRNPKSFAGKRGGSKKVPKGFAKSGLASEAGRKGAEKRWGKRDEPAA